MNPPFNETNFKEAEADEDFKPLSVVIEEAMLSEYFLLVRRVPGISLSPEEYWDLDTFTTQYLLDCEKEVIKAEEDASKGKSTHKYEEFSSDDSPEMVDYVMNLTEEA